MLPGWNSLDAVSRIDTTIRIVTLVFWSLLVGSEIVARYFWTTRKTLLDTVALFAFLFAVLGEIAQFKYDGRKEVLQQQREQQLKQDYESKLQQAQKDYEEKLSQARKDNEKAVSDAATEQADISKADTLASEVRANATNPFDSALVHQLINLMYESPYPKVRAIARDTFHQISVWFYANVSPNSPLFVPNKLGFISNEVNGQTTMARVNRPDSNTADLFRAFYDMKRLTDWNVETFDIKGANEWCRKHDCKLTTPTR